MQALANRPTMYKSSDTKPNYYQIVNNGAAQVYVSATAGISQSVFDLIIPPFGTRIFAKALPVEELWLLATQNTQLYIACLQTEFTPAMIAQTQEISANSATGLLGVLDVRNVINPLPAGANVIGGVFVSALPALPAGGNHVGSVTVDQIMPGTNKVGIVEVDPSGWTAVKVVAAAPGDVVVKASPGLVSQLTPDAAEVIYLVDGVTQKWKTGGYAGDPISCTTDIKINFAAAGAAWIVYR